jgi:hypothetical protein
MALALVTNVFSQQSRPHMDLLEIRMQRTACYGECPVYTLTLDANGRIQFDGTEYVETKGVVESAITAEKRKLLIAEINRADFFALKDSYTGKSGNCPTTATDMPSVTLRIRLNGKDKTIEHYLGCFDAVDIKGSLPIFPDKLVRLEDKIDDIIGTDKWIKKGT